MKKSYQKMLILLLLAVVFVGVFGGIGYCIYIKQYVIAVCIAILGIMFWPTAKEWWWRLNS